MHEGTLPPFAGSHSMLENNLGQTLARLALATVLGLALGFERERTGHDAGLRTHGLVALSSAMLTLSAIELSAQFSESDPVRVIQGLAQAIGFIAGGLIFVRGGGVRNLTTATSLWMAAAVGITAGAGQYVLVLTGSFVALTLLSLLPIFERSMKRNRPEEEQLADVDELALPNRRGAIEPQSERRKSPTQSDS